VNNPNPEEIYKKLFKRNHQAAESYLLVFKKLSGQLSKIELGLWSSITQDFVEKGWHSWRCALDYLDLSSFCQNKLGNEALIHTGEFALNLLELSQQSAQSYLKGVHIALEKDRLDTILIIESCGQSLKQSYPQASNLLTDFYEIAFQFEMDALNCWCETIGSLAASGRQAVYDYVQLSQKYPEVNWEYASKLYLLSKLLGRSYIEMPELFTGKLHLEPGSEHRGKQFRKLLLQTARTHPDIDWLQVLILKSLKSEKIHQIVLLSEDDPHLLLALIEVVDCLPQDRTDALRTWVEEGRKLSLQNHAAGIAFLKLESNQGQRRLDRILGRVRLSDHQRSLKIYLEGMSDAPLRLSESQSGLVYNEENTIYLPTLIGLYNTIEENFKYLKLAITHQLASYEFGTFRFRYLDSPFPFTHFFHSFNNPDLASTLFRLLESARLDWRLEHEYKGLKQLLRKVKPEAFQSLEFDQDVHELLRFVLWLTLDGSHKGDELSEIQKEILESISILRIEGASVADTAIVLTKCYTLLTDDLGDQSICTKIPSVHYRGRLDLSSSFSVLQFGLSSEEAAKDQQDAEQLGPPAEGDISELVQGDAPDAEGIELLESMTEANETSKKELGPETVEMEGRASSEQQEHSYLYDEWDYQINDYRTAWCTLYEMRAKDENREYVSKTLLELDHVSRQVKKQLNKIRPELHQKIKGLVDGEELDLDRAISAVIDRKSGFCPSEAIYVQKQKQLRDVAALFLLDMSASTDDVIDDQDSGGNKIIDLEKKAVILMAEGLEKLGDRYAICGFSGYGRDRIEYTVCKSFDDSYDNTAKARIGGIKPCRSTRMGPAIRHASRMLQETDAKVKALIILSDGYPQDFDYGSDRSSKIYGIRDTAKALVEASGFGVISFCLTVDPSGHDYLKEMCPAKKYMVMQDISQLPTELSKIYQSLTTS